MPVFPLTPEQLAAIKQFLQGLFRSVTTAILVFLAGGVGTSEILHPLTHTAGGGHKTNPITNTTRREDRGETGVEIQYEEGEIGTAREDARPTDEGPPLVHCEAAGYKCANRLPSGFCRLRQHPCIIAPHSDFLISLDSKIDQLLGLVHPKAAVAATQPPDIGAGKSVRSAEFGVRNGKRILHTLGNFEYLTGFEDVWINRQHYDLRGRNLARWCVEYLVIMRAFDPASARNFLDEIDPYVMEKSGYGARGKFSEVKIQDYFREPSGKLLKLCQSLIRSAGKNGGYYLKTDAV